MGGGRKGLWIVPVALVMLFFGVVCSMAYAQSYSSSSDSSNAVCCCCCLPVLLFFVLILLGNKSKARPQPQPVVVQATAPPQQPVQVIYKEKEIIREVVKVPCEYCGTLVEVTTPKCPSCGAPQNR